MYLYYCLVCVQMGFSCKCHLWWHTYVAPGIACDTHWLLKTVVGRIQNTAKWFLLSNSQNQKTPEKFQEFWLCSYQSQLILGCTSKLQNHKLITISVTQLLHWASLPQNPPQNLMVTKEIKYKLPLFILGNVLIAIILLWPSKFLKQIIQIKLYKVKNPNW